MQTICIKCPIFWKKNQNVVLLEFLTLNAKHWKHDYFSENIKKKKNQDFFF